MKEFVEKLIGRLEELRKEYYADYNTYRVERDLGNVDGLKHAIKIINELAEEYNNDFCEWKYIDSTSHNATIPCRGNTMNIKSMRYYTYCPYCGKKIKVVE